MRRFAETADAIHATSKKSEKVALAAGYLRSLPVSEASLAAIFFSGRPFAAAEEATLQVGATLLWQLAGEVAGASDQQLRRLYRKYGDLGDVLEAALSESTSAGNSRGISLTHLAAAFHELAAARGAAKAPLVERLLRQAAPAEARYIVKIILGDLRIGFRESLVEEAIARAWQQPLAQVQRANMLLGDLGATVALAADGRLEKARLRLFHPIGFMLANPVANAEEAAAAFPDLSLVTIEDKYDGIRAQAHIGMRDGVREVRIYSRTRDEITESFPELVPALLALSGELVLDGEIVAWQRRHGEGGCALPFSTLQQRLGRKKISIDLQRGVPIAYLVFDLICVNGELLLDRPLRDRSQGLDAVFSSPRIAVATARPAEQLPLLSPVPEPPAATLLRASSAKAATVADLHQLFDQARERGNEGLMLKDLESPYTPGRRGGAWLKLKRELATLDVVVTAAEYGHGKRIGVLSDYTFAVRDDHDPERLLDIGKAYSGLTDAEIAELTEFFLAHTLVEEGFRLQVEPLVVLEVAFNNVMKSDRYPSGFALRFPRIARWRKDKVAAEIDTLAVLREIYRRQR